MINHEDTKTQRNEIDPEMERVAQQVVDAALTVHRALGPGLLESVYEICLAHELKKRNLKVERQVDLPVIYDGIRIDGGLRLDLLVNESLIVEIKTVEELHPIHTAQAITYLKLSKRRLALLINFNVPLIKNGIKRIIL